MLGYCRVIYLFPLVLLWFGYKQILFIEAYISGLCNDELKNVVNMLSAAEIYFVIMIVTKLGNVNVSITNMLQIT